MRHAVASNEQGSNEQAVRWVGRGRGGAAVWGNLGGTAVSLGQVIPATAIPTLVYTPVANANGAATFTYSVSDGTAFSAAPGTATLTVTAVNDPPTISGTPANDDVGVYEGIVISVTDGIIATPVALPAFDIAVTNTNDVPTANAGDDQTVTGPETSSFSGFSLSNCIASMTGLTPADTANADTAGDDRSDGADRSAWFDPRNLDDDIGTVDGALVNGALDASLNSVYPYGYWSPRAGLGLWGLLGVGSGDATLTHRETAFATDLDMRMGALGLRLELADELEMELFGGRNASGNRSPEHLLGLTGCLRF